MRALAALAVSIAVIIFWLINSPHSAIGFPIKDLSKSGEMRFAEGVVVSNLAPYKQGPFSGQVFDCSHILIWHVIRNKSDKIAMLPGAKSGGSFRLYVRQRKIEGVVNRNFDNIGLDGGFNVVSRRHAVIYDLRPTSKFDVFATLVARQSG